MKKFFALLIACMMLFSAAMAETAEVVKETVEYDDTLSFRTIVPEGYRLSQETIGGVLLMELIPDEETNVNFALVIAPDDNYTDFVTLNDMTDDEKAAFAESYRIEGVDMTWEIRETGLGTQLVLLKEEADGFNCAYIAALYHGYIISCYIDHADGSPITEEEISAVIWFNTNLDFVFAE